MLSPPLKLIQEILSGKVLVNVSRVGSRPDTLDSSNYFCKYFPHHYLIKFSHPRRDSSAQPPSPFSLHAESAKILPLLSGIYSFNAAPLLYPTMQSPCSDHRVQMPDPQRSHSALISACSCVSPAVLPLR